jgi:hypothetical protein
LTEKAILSDMVRLEGLLREGEQREEKEVDKKYGRH